MSKSSKGSSFTPAPRKTDLAAGQDFDDDRNVRLTGPYRALWRAARAAAKTAAAIPEIDTKSPPDPIHWSTRRQVEELLADTGVSDADRRRVLDSIACPCCSGTGSSFAMTIRPAAETKF